MTSAEMPSMLKLSKRDEFLASYHPQQAWTFPSDSVIFYILKNPPTIKLYQKMVKNCKYFFIENPILIFEELYINAENEWELCSKNLNSKINFANFSLNKFWITENFQNFRDNTESEKQISSVISKIYRCEAKVLSLSNQNITFKEFLFLSSNVEEIALCGCVVVKTEDGAIVTAEKLVQSLSNVKFINFLNIPASSFITSNTVKEFLEFSHFSKIDKFVMYSIPETFEIEQFFNYIKKNKHTNFEFYFGNPLSEAYKNRLETIIDEIIEAENREYKIPFFHCGEIAPQKQNKLYQLYHNL